MSGHTASQEEATGRSEAVDFLAAALADGEQQAGEVTRQADRLGISRDKLRRAREILGVKPRPADAIRPAFSGKLAGLPFPDR